MGETLTKELENMLQAEFTDNTGNCKKCETRTEVLFNHPSNGKPIYANLCANCKCELALQEEKSKKKELLAQKPANFAKRLARCGLEKIELKSSFGNFKANKNNIEAYNASRQFALKDGKGVFLISPPGMGKTHLAAATIKVLVARGKSCKFYKVTDMLGYLRSCFSEYSNISEAEAIDDLARIDVLFLDDFGAERTTDYALDALYRVIDRRYRRELPIFATANLDLDELSKKIDDRIPSRLAAMCKGNMIHFNDKDWRLK